MSGDKLVQKPLLERGQFLLHPSERAWSVRKRGRRERGTGTMVWASLSKLNETITPVLGSSKGNDLTRPVQFE